MTTRDYYKEATQEDLECSNAGNALGFLAAAQGEIEQLRADLAAAKARADALQSECDEWQSNYAALEAVAIASERERKALAAKLAAVPIDAMYIYLREMERTPQGKMALDLIWQWLNAQSQAQP